jgi:predicted acetyltransferase
MLPDAVQCVEESGYPISTLHAAEGVRKLYAKYGYKEIGSVCYGRLPLSYETSHAGMNTHVTELNDDSVVMLGAVRTAFHRRLRLIGGVARSAAAWQSLIPLIGATHVLLDSAGAVAAYAIVGNKAGVWMLGDFGATDAVTGAEARR